MLIVNCVTDRLGVCGTGELKHEKNEQFVKVFQVCHLIIGKGGGGYLKEKYTYTNTFEHKLTTLNGTNDIKPITVSKWMRFIFYAFKSIHILIFFEFHYFWKGLHMHFYL